MEQLKTDFGYQIRLETGEEIHNCLAGFMKETELPGGTVIGIGAMSSFTLGYYDIHQEKYIRTEYEEDVELVTCVGNLAYKGSQPIAHLHAVVSNAKMKTLGGHLFNGVISATGEFSILDSKVKLNRLNKAMELPLLNLR